MTLVCLECEEKFTVYGDAALDLIVYEWRQGQAKPGESYGPPIHPAVVRLAEHEHDSARFIEKTSRLPWFSREVSGLSIGEPLG